MKEHRPVSHHLALPQIFGSFRVTLSTNPSPQPNQLPLRSNNHSFPTPNKFTVPIPPNPLVHHAAARTHGAPPQAPRSPYGRRGEGEEEGGQERAQALGVRAEGARY